MEDLKRGVRKYAYQSSAARRSRENPSTENQLHTFTGTFIGKLMASATLLLTVQQKNVFGNLRDLIEELNHQAPCLQGEAQYDLETLQGYVSYLEANYSIHCDGKTVRKARQLIRLWTV